MFAYNPLSDQWSEKSRFPEEDFNSLTSFCLGNKAYVLMTIDRASSVPNSTNNLWEYDATNDTWTQKSSFPGVNRYGALGAAYDGKGYTGLGIGINTTDFWSYDPSLDNWTQMPDFPGHRRGGFGTAVLNNELFIIGGMDGNSPFDSDIWKFNFTSQQWTIVGYFDYFLIALFLHHSSCYIITGEYNYNTNEMSFYLNDYNPATNQIISHLGIFPGEIRSRIGLSICDDNYLYFGLGSRMEEGVFLDDVWRYPLSEIK